VCMGAAPPDITIVVPTRNRCAWLMMTLRSVLRQRHVALEVVVVDEASTDDTAAAIAALHDPRIRVIRHDPPKGVSTARNRGAADARGEWIGFVDDDDVWAPDKIARQIDAANRLGCEWTYTGSVNITADGYIMSGRPPLGPKDVVAALTRYNAIPGGGSNVILRRSTWGEVGLFETRLHNTEDWEMWLRLAKRGLPALVCHPLVGYRVHSFNSSLDVAEIVRGARLIEAMHQTTVDWGRLHRWMAESCLRRGQRGAAIAEFARAIACGNIRAVLGDLARMCRRRLPRREVSEPPVATHRDPWISSAAAWLNELHAEASGATLPCRGLSRVPGAMAR
jgi:glycosyltransferase involved in cell wall biosynthesis